MRLHTIGINLGKAVFHLVRLNPRGEVVVRKKFSRKRLLHFTANLLDGKKEVRTGPNPAGVIERESAGGDNAVDMGTDLELLVPGVEHTEIADLSPEISGITGDLEKSFSAGTKQQTIEYFLFCRASPAS